MSKNLEKYENRYDIYIYEKTASYILNFLSHAYHNNRERQC